MSKFNVVVIKSDRIFAEATVVGDPFGLNPVCAEQYSIAVPTFPKWLELLCNGNPIIDWPSNTVTYYIE